MPIGDDAQCAWRFVIESDLAGPLHVEPALGVLVVGVDLLEIALQIGDAVEIGIDALHGGILLLADQRRRPMRGFHCSVPARTFVSGIRVYLAGGSSGSGWIRLRCVVGLTILWGDGAGGGRRFLHRRAVLGERNSARTAKYGR